MDHTFRADRTPKRLCNLLSAAGAIYSMRMTRFLSHPVPLQIFPMMIIAFIMYLRELNRKIRVRFSNSFSICLSLKLSFPPYKIMFNNTSTPFLHPVSIFPQIMDHEQYNTEVFSQFIFSPAFTPQDPPHLPKGSPRFFSLSFSLLRTEKIHSQCPVYSFELSDTSRSQVDGWMDGWARYEKCNKRNEPESSEVSFEKLAYMIYILEFNGSQTLSKNTQIRDSKSIFFRKIIHLIHIMNSKSAVKIIKFPFARAMR